jgi:hypothetical protein
MSTRILAMLLAVLVLSACVEPPTANDPSLTPSPALTATPAALSVAELLQNPPAAGVPVEIDAYFNGDQWMAVPGDMSASGNCLEPFLAVFTDQPFQSQWMVLNEVASNRLPEDAPWLIAAQPQSSWTEILPYHGRFRGRLGDPAYAACPFAERIFTIEQVVAVYAAQAPLAVEIRVPPEQRGAWQTYHDAELGYSLRYPREWSQTPLVEPDSLGGVVLRDPQWPDAPVTVRVHDGEARWDPFDVTPAPWMAGTDFTSVYAQSLDPGESRAPLAGVVVGRTLPDGTQETTALLAAHGRTYELTVRYHDGFDVPQAVMTAYGSIVDAEFRLDVAPEPTPTPPIKQVLGPGPFLTQEQALDALRQSHPDPFELLSADLVPEATARCYGADMDGHPNGIWMLVVRGVFDGEQRTMRLYLDGVTGEFLAGEQIIPPDATPWPTVVLPPGVPTPPPPPTSPSCPIP